MNMHNAPMIRKAGPEDLEAVYHMICALSDETFEREPFRQVYLNNINHPDCFYCIAVTENEPIGFISLHIQQLLHHNGAVGEIQEFYIKPGYRGMGMGKLLMNTIIAHAKDKELTSLEVASNKKRIENVAVYEKLGFTLSHNKFTRQP